MVNVKQIIQEQNEHTLKLLVTLEDQTTRRVVQAEATRDTLFECMMVSVDREDVLNLEEQNFHIQALKLNLRLIRSEKESVIKSLKDNILYKCWTARVLLLKSSNKKAFVVDDEVWYLLSSSNKSEKSFRSVVTRQ